jgi:Putative Se/S carrier protein-like
MGNEHFMELALGRAYGLLTFDSTNTALKVERLLKDARVECSVIPTPLEITADCGISLLLKEAWVDKAKEALAAASCDGFTLAFPFER